MITKKQYDKMAAELVALAEKKGVKFSNQLYNSEDYPYFTINNYTVPTVADVTEIARKYKLPSCVIERQPSWGFIAIDFSLYPYKSEEEAEKIFSYARS